MTKRQKDERHHQMSEKARRERDNEATVLILSTSGPSTSDIYPTTRKRAC